jgi:hypothetical protein
MSTLKATAITGEKPRIILRLLPGTAAQDAINVRLEQAQPSATCPRRPKLTHLPHS